jgi:predicted GNAT family acetyltransferase
LRLAAFARGPMTALKIENNPAASRFEVQVNGKVARLNYRLEQDTIFLLYVEVPTAEEGRGIGSSLAKAALEFARDHGLKVVPQCPFIASYIRKHRDLYK